MNTEEIIKNLEEELGITLIRRQIENLSEVATCSDNIVLTYKGDIVALALVNLAIIELPKTLERLTELKYFCIKECMHLSEFQNLKYLINLEEIVLIMPIKKLPTEMKYLKKIKKVSVYSVWIIDLKVLRFIKRSIKSIVLRAKGPQIIPKIISSFKNLEELHVKMYSGITDISNLKNLPKLKKLAIANLYIDSLPESLNTLKNLEYLMIYKSSVGNMDKLNDLPSLRNLSVNILKEENYPEDLSRFPSLKVFNGKEIF